MPKVSTRGRGAPRRTVNAALAALLASACGGYASSRADIDGESTGGSSSLTPGVSEGGGTVTPSGPSPAVPNTPSDGSGVLESPAATPFGPGSPPPELARVEDDSPGPAPVNGVCPTGTEPIEPANCTSIEKRGLRPAPCLCQYVCSPACGIGQVCAPAAEADAGATACRCHAALDPSEQGCSWTGLLQNAGFDDDAGWKLWTSGLASASSTSIGSGELRLELNARCAYAWAGTTARLPSRDQFPNGAALAFDYDSNARADDAGTPRVFLDGMLHVSLPKTSGRVRERHCVQLQDAPRLASLYFDVETYGTCAEPLDYRLIVTDVRLEANAGCL